MKRELLTYKNPVKRRSAVAKDLRTPKYRMRVKPNKKKNNIEEPKDSNYNDD